MDAMNAHRCWRRLFAALLCAGGAVASLSTGGCTKDPEIVERPLVIYSPKSCPISETDAYSVIYAGGDFEPSSDRPPIASVFLRELGRSMEELPPETRSLVVDVSQRNVDWRGLVDVPSKGPVNVLLWRTHEACRLTRDVERRTGMTLGIAGSQFIIAGGRSIDGPAVPHTFVGNLNTGAIERLQFGLNTRRLFSTITSFRAPSEVDAASALIAGGEDPDTGQAIDNAEIYVPKIGGAIGDFEREHIPLSRGRTRHAALVLPSGETLLIGGADETGGPLPSMELVDPVSRRARTAGVALLANARTNPIAVRLSSGEILVWAGLGDRGRIVQEIEWILPDASDHSPKPSIPLVTGRERAIVPLEGGGALAVIAPDRGGGNQEEFDKFQTVWVISADGFVEPANPIDPNTLDTVRLFPGAEGAPVLWTGRRWLRWSPWFGAFQPIPEAPERGPSLGVEDGVPHSFVTADPGLALWLEDRREVGMSISGFRFATRSRFDAVPKPLLIRGPDQLAPDRLAGVPSSSLRFDNDLGLVLGPGSSAFLTDVTFANFELSVDVTGGSPTVVLRLVDSGTEYEVGGGGCPISQTPTKRLFVRRTGAKVEVQVDEQPFRNCVNELSTASVRVAIGLRGSAQATGRSSVKNLVVTRR
jgi:hypothetical protein